MWRSWLLFGIDLSLETSKRCESRQIQTSTHIQIDFGVSVRSSMAICHMSYYWKIMVLNLTSAITELGTTQRIDILSHTQTQPMQIVPMVLDCVIFTRSRNTLPDELFRATLMQLISEQLSHSPGKSSFLKLMERKMQIGN